MTDKSLQERLGILVSEWMECDCPDAVHKWRHRASEFIEANHEALTSALADQRRLREAHVVEVLPGDDWGCESTVVDVPEALPIGQRVAVVPLDQEGE